MTTKPNNESTTETGAGRTGTPVAFNVNDWNITRIVVGHDSNHGKIPDAQTLIDKLEHFQSHQNARLLAERDALKKALEKATFRLELNLAAFEAKIIYPATLRENEKTIESARALLATLAP